MYDYIDDFSEGLASVMLKGKWGHIDKIGKLVIPCKYGNSRAFKDGLARVCLNSKCGYIDKTGTQVIPCIYDDAYDFEGGLAVVILNGKYGIIDKNGKEVIPVIYDRVYIGDFSNDGLALVMTDKEQIGYIDKEGTQYWED
jgi:hypothetical protein